MVSEGRKLIYVDEVCFTKRTISTHTYSSQFKNIMVDESKLYDKAVFAIAGVSEKRGVEYL